MPPSVTGTPLNTCWNRISVPPSACFWLTITAGLRADLRGLPVGTTLVELGPVETSMLERAEDYPPTQRSFQRFRRLQMLVDLEPAKVADAVVDAVRRERPHVRLPKRVATFAMLPEAPRRLTRWLLTGVPHQPR